MPEAPSEQRRTPVTEAEKREHILGFQRHIFGDQVAIVILPPEELPICDQSDLHPIDWQAQTT